MERVRELAATGDNAEDLGAARRVAASRLSRTSALPAPSAITKPSRFLAKGRTAFCGGSLWVESADSSEKRISASGFTWSRRWPRTAPHRLRRGGSLRRRAGSQWRRGATRSTARSASPWCRTCPARWSATEPNMEAAVILDELAAAGDAQQCVVIDIAIGAGGLASTWRCVHSTSTGATARNNGPGKSPLLPILACAMASSVTSSPSFFGEESVRRKTARPARNRSCLPSSSSCRRWENA